jgi:hypothetical protein
MLLEISAIEHTHQFKLIQDIKDEIRNRLMGKDAILFKDMDNVDLYNCFITVFRHEAKKDMQIAMLSQKRHQIITMLFEDDDVECDDIL